MYIEIFKNKFIDIVEVINQPNLINVGKWKILSVYTPPEFQIPKEKLDKQTILYLEELLKTGKTLDQVRTYVNHFNGNRSIISDKVIINFKIYGDTENDYLVQCDYYN